MPESLQKVDTQETVQKEVVGNCRLDPHSWLVNNMTSGFVVALSYVYICIFCSISYITMRMQRVCIQALIYKGYKIVQEIYKQTFNWL